jgi:hypothetical protein
MGNYGKIIIFLLAICLSGLSWALPCRASDLETLPPASEAEAKPPDLNLGDLLPRSEESLPEPAPRWYTITNRPPQPQTQTQGQTEPARPREAATPAPEAPQTPLAHSPAERVNPEKPEEPALAPEQAEPPAKPEDQTAPPALALGRQLSIPPQATENQDLSFLQGCWIRRYKTTGIPGVTAGFGILPDDHCTADGNTCVYEEICFNDKGQGTRLVTQVVSSLPADRRVSKYSGPVQAGFDSAGRLTLNIDYASCITPSTCIGEYEKYWVPAIEVCAQGSDPICQGEYLEECSSIYWQCKYTIVYHRREDNRPLPGTE